MRIWGITGTNGKTTVTWILAEFLKAAYITTVEVNTTKRVFSTGYTTPPLPVLKEIFAEMETLGVKDCVMEVSSHAIYQRRTGDTVFAGGAFTNLSEDHLDYHKTMEAYFQAKFLFAERLAEGCAIRPDDGRRAMPPFVVCIDGDYGRRMLEAAGTLPINVIPVSVKSPRYDLSDLKLAGEYNKANVLVAAALAEAAGVSREEIQRIIPTLRPRWGRMEDVPSKAKARIIVDFAHTPDGLQKVLEASRAFTRGRLWAVFGAGGDRDRAKRPLMGEAAAKTADCLVVTSDNPRSEDPLAIIDEIMVGVRRAVSDTSCVAVEVDRAKAISYALSNAQSDDVVLVCGKGHETTQEIKGVKYPFDDREIVRNYIPIVC